ncbi:metal ABC transporter solute-binding protein, Zn/Mn family [Halohasta salina]|uniref:metal ABC transporter solute-binding protein, Zn/Mn family n=1 Tax=Halohasta salina TaxID=2961621 RepID=UPI0020A2D022|nr:zinc ABC transporter substrate-binding protein [Halohasta salina]
MNPTRRRVLRSGAGALALGGLAGCLDETAGGPTGFDSAYAAFFALADWSQAVAGDAATVENPVDFGQLGHGWEPDGDLPREVASTDAFVYLDTPEFSWAQDLASTLEADYEGVAAIDALDGLESRMIDSSHGHGHGDEHAEDADAHDGEDEHHDETEDGHHNETEDGHHNETGDEHHDEHADETASEVDRGQFDPHVWVDPVLAQEMVDTIAAGFAEIDPENGESYETNAAAYNDRLADLDSQLQALADDAERSTVVLATHSSFAYVEARYDFEIHTVAGISPDAEPDSSEIAGTVDLVDESGIDVILYDRFESDRLAETIVENSGATETMAVTAGAGTLREWADDGLDFVDQMEQITIPAFRRALGAE